jgi:hypothetical protein
MNGGAILLNIGAWQDVRDFIHALSTKYGGNTQSEYGDGCA